MPDRPTDADLARWEWLGRYGGTDKLATAARTAVPALVDEVRRLRDVLTRIADGDGYGSATECWCWDIAADALRLEGPDACDDAGFD